MSRGVPAGERLLNIQPGSRPFEKEFGLTLWFEAARGLVVCSGTSQHSIEMMAMARGVMLLNCASNGVSAGVGLHRCSPEHPGRRQCEQR
jgi:hypothetical protein